MVMDHPGSRGVEREWVRWRERCEGREGGECRGGPVRIGVRGGGDWVERRGYGRPDPCVENEVEEGRMQLVELNYRPDGLGGLESPRRGRWPRRCKRCSSRCCAARSTP